MKLQDVKVPRFPITYEQAQRLVDELEPGTVAYLKETEVDEQGRSSYKVSVNWISGYAEFTLSPKG